MWYKIKPSSLLCVLLEVDHLPIQIVCESSFEQLVDPKLFIPVQEEEEENILAVHITSTFVSSEEKQVEHSWNQFLEKNECKSYHLLLRPTELRNDMKKLISEFIEKRIESSTSCSSSPILSIYLTERNINVSFLFVTTYLFALFIHLQYKSSSSFQTLKDIPLITQSLIYQHSMLWFQSILPIFPPIFQSHATNCYSIMKYWKLLSGATTEEEKTGIKAYLDIICLCKHSPPFYSLHSFPSSAPSIRSRQESISSRKEQMNKRRKRISTLNPEDSPTSSTSPTLSPYFNKDSLLLEQGNKRMEIEEII